MRRILTWMAEHFGRKVSVKIEVALIILLCCLGSVAMEANADFGDYNSYNSGSDSGSSGSDWGSSGSDWGSSGGGWDSGSDWNSGSSYSGNSWRSESNDSDSGMYGFFIVIAVIVFIYSVLRGCLNSFNASNSSSQQHYSSENHKEHLADRSTQIIGIITDRDPEFSSLYFLTFAKKVFVDIQNAWSARDLSSVEGVMHQNLYEQTQKQVDKKIADHVTNKIERICVDKSYMNSYWTDAEHENVIVYIQAGFVDYQVNDDTGAVILGNTRDKCTMSYRMTFSRTLDSKTEKGGAVEKSMTCPNCGAPMKGTSFGKCEFCGSVITTGKYGWVLTDYDAVHSDTEDRGITL